MSTILVDVDGVVADTHKSWLEMYNQDYDDDLKVEEVTKWALHEFVKPECGRDIYKYLENPDFYDNTPMIDGALAGVRYLREIGHRVIFVSAGFFESKVRWLGRMGFLQEFPYPNDVRPSTATDVILCNDKSLIRGDYLIDDRHANVLNFHSTGILFNQPWNSEILYDNRVYTWIDIGIYFHQQRAIMRNPK